MRRPQRLWPRGWAAITLSLMTALPALPAIAIPPRSPDQTVECELLIAGGGFAGAATAYEALLSGRTVCMTEITDWVGGQVSSQGVSALDERSRQRSLLFYARGYNEFRQRIADHYGRQNPGECWVSASCFLPRDGHEILVEMLDEAEKEGDGELHWFPATVIKDLDYSADGRQIERAIAIQHNPAPGTPPRNTEPLSQIFTDAYDYQDSERFTKTILEFVPLPRASGPADWYVIDATETGELIALADVPYQLGIDPRTHREPSSSSVTGDRYCTQGFTYTFAMEKQAEPQTYDIPEFYARYEPYYSYEQERFASVDLLFTYRRILSPTTGPIDRFGGIGWTAVTPGDISMQNWTWGNDYRPGTAQDNLIYTRDQLQDSGQLGSGNWQGGLRQSTLARGEEHALGFFYWLVAGTTDSQLGDGFKEPDPTHDLLTGLDAPMGTMHGLSKYPYLREGRRIIGRPYLGYPDGFMVTELDISTKDYTADYYRENLTDSEYRDLWVALAGLETIDAIQSDRPSETVTRRTRSTIFPDGVGISVYYIDFHPCMNESPPYAPGNTERQNARQGEGPSYPAQIPLRALIPQRLDNLLVAGKSIATSHVAAAAYRIHSFEWSVGAAAGTTADFALSEGVMPYELVETMPRSNPALRRLQERLRQEGNPPEFPNTSIFNEDWEAWK
ncbi:MAG: FAD-dependent oxidoreductase [Spirulinaceae cyanobacterium SM2_1_0]|nr:FAD-dependent oxidoreductase [Spirulinaceae cyanobacterium SM2_1_0]